MSSILDGGAVRGGGVDGGGKERRISASTNSELHQMDLAYAVDEIGDRGLIATIMT